MNPHDVVPYFIPCLILSPLNFITFLLSSTEGVALMIISTPLTHFIIIFSTYGNICMLPVLP